MARRPNLVDADNVPDRSAAAAGIAVINSLGDLGGFFGPTMVGQAKQLTGSFAGGLYALALCALMSAVVSLFGLRIHNAVGRPSPPPCSPITSDKHSSASPER